MPKPGREFGFLLETLSLHQPGDPSHRNQAIGSRVSRLYPELLLLVRVGFLINVWKGTKFEKVKILQIVNFIFVALK